MVIKFAGVVALSSAVAVAQISTWSLQVGGAGTANCSGAQLPNGGGNGTQTTASMLFSYDKSLAQLTVLVNNTSPIVAGYAAPQITKARFNVPRPAVTGMTLVSQTSASGAAANWSFSFDADTTTSPQPNNCKLNCFGSFNVGLNVPNGNHNAIVRADAPGANLVDDCGDSITFVFNVSGPGTQFINAGAFANSLASGGGGGTAQAGIKGQGMNNGVSEEAGVTGSCAPTAYATGQASPGCHMDLYFTGATGCGGCLVASFNPGPTTVGGTTYDIGYPFYDILSVTTISGQLNHVPVDLPNIPEIIGLSLYFSTGLYQPSTGLVFVAQSFTVTFVAGNCSN